MARRQSMANGMPPAYQNEPIPMMSRAVPPYQPIPIGSQYNARSAVPNNSFKNNRVAPPPHDYNTYSQPNNSFGTATSGMSTKPLMRTSIMYPNNPNQPYNNSYDIPEQNDKQIPCYSKPLCLGLTRLSGGILFGTMALLAAASLGGLIVSIVLYSQDSSTDPQWKILGMVVCAIMLLTILVTLCIFIYCYKQGRILNSNSTNNIGNNNDPNSIAPQYNQENDLSNPYDYNQENGFRKPPYDYKQENGFTKPYNRNQPYDSRRPMNNNQPYDSGRPTNNNQPYDPGRPMNNNQPYDVRRPTNYNQPYDARRPTNYNQPYDARRPTNYNQPYDARRPTNYNQPYDRSPIPYGMMQNGSPVYENEDQIPVEDKQTNTETTIAPLRPRDFQSGVWLGRNEYGGVSYLPVEPVKMVNRLIQASGNDIDQSILKLKNQEAKNASQTVVQRPGTRLELVEEKRPRRIIEPQPRYEIVEEIIERPRRGTVEEVIEIIELPKKAPTKQKYNKVSVKHIKTIERTDDDFNTDHFYQ